MIDWFKRHSFVIPVLTALAITLVCARRGMSQAQILMIVVPFAVVYAILDWGVADQAAASPVAPTQAFEARGPLRVAVRCDLR